MTTTLETMIQDKRKRDQEAADAERAKRIAEARKKREALAIKFANHFGPDLLLALRNAGMQEVLEDEEANFLRHVFSFGGRTFSLTTWTRMVRGCDEIEVRLAIDNPNHDPEVEESHPWVDYGLIYDADGLLGLLGAYAPKDLA